MCVHKALLLLREKVDLEHQCGYITMLNPNNRHRRRASESSDGRGEWRIAGRGGYWCRVGVGLMAGG